MLNVCIWTLNESFWLKTIFKTALENDDVITIMIFIINQMKLRKKFMIATCMKDHLNNICKSESFNVQKLQLKEIMTANDIAHDVLDAFYYSVYFIMFWYHLITVL